MKRLHLLIIFLACNLLCCKTLANIVVLDPAMSQSQALTQPYTLTKTVIADSNAIELDFKLNVVEFSDFDKVPGTKACLIPGAPTLSEPGKPQLSFIQQKYNIPSSQLCRIVVTDSAYVDFSVQLAPGEVLTCDGTSINNNFSITPYQGFFPACCVEPTPIQFFKGIPIHYFLLYPITYDYTNQKVRVYTSFKAKLTFDEIEYDKESNRSATFRATRQSQLSGSVEILDFWDDMGLATYPRERTQDYLIVANKYTKGLDDFIEWKKTLGYRVHVIKDIPNDPAGYIWTWQQLKSVITNAYNQLDNLNYVLLWGGPVTLPGIPFSEYGSEYHQSLHFSDSCYSYTAYSLIDGKNDFTPKFSVGRICALDSCQSIQAGGKIIDYEKNPVRDSAFYATAFLAGQFEPQNGGHIEDENMPTGFDTNNLPIEDTGFIQWLERSRPILQDNGVDAKRIYKRRKWLVDNNIYPTTWSQDRSYNINDSVNFATPRQSIIPEELQYPNFAWDGDSTKIRQIVNRGAFLGMYYGHGNCYGWEHMDKIQADMFESCGVNRPLIFSISCSTGSGWNGSFANRLSAAQNGPIGIFASVDVSYIVPNQYFLYGLTNCIFPDFAPTNQTGYFSKYEKSFRLGDILQRANEFCGDHVAPNFRLHNVITYTCFGDPSVDFNTDVPTNFDSPNIYSYGSDVYIDLYSVNEQYPIFINFYEKSSGRIESYLYQGPTYYFKASEDATEVQVSITSHNKIPYISNIQTNIVNDNPESYYPRPIGKFTNATLINSNTLSVDFERSQNLDNYSIRYVVFNNTLESVDADVTVPIDIDAESFQIPLSSGFRGYIQLYLIKDQILLDCYRVAVTL